MQNNSQAQESKGFYKLSWLQRIGFGSGDLAQNLIFQVICTYLLFFYTDIYGLTPSAVAVMFLVGNVANVIWDPIVGALIDKSNPRYGKYRSYLLYVGIPLSGFAILCFFNGFVVSRHSLLILNSCHHHERKTGHSYRQDLGVRRAPGLSSRQLGRERQRPSEGVR